MILWMWREVAMLLGARLFIIFVYSIIGLSFWAVTGTLIYEFHDADWFTIATFYSHLFIFFPIFGTVALFAFYWPSVVFLDMYWRHVPWGRPRFVAGFLVIAALSFVVAQELTRGPVRSLFEILPATLLADKGEPEGCGGAAGSCSRLPILAGLNNVRQISQRRIGLTDLVRNCAPDPLIEQLEQLQPRRYCFVSTPSTQSPVLTSDSDCCRAQRSFMSVANSDTVVARSLTSLVHTWTLPLKVFFLLTLLVIGILLAVRRKMLESTYAADMGEIEKGVLVGAAAMLFFPVMNHAFLQSAAMLDVAGASNSYRSPAPFFSFTFGAWALILVFFFYRRRDKEVEFLGRISGVIASAVAILKYDIIISYFVRFAGSGASPTDIGILCAIGFVLLGMLQLKTGNNQFAGARMFGPMGPAKGGVTAGPNETTPTDWLDGERET
jgi:hypothetical protein